MVEYNHVSYVEGLNLIPVTICFYNLHKYKWYNFLEENGGKKDSLSGRVLTLHADDSGSIPGTLYGYLSPTRSEHWAQSQD